MRILSSRPPPVPALRAHALIAGALTFVIVVLALAAYGLVADDACLSDARRPVEAQWSGSQRLTAWPPAAVRCNWTEPSGLDRLRRIRVAVLHPGIRARGE